MHTNNEDIADQFHKHLYAQTWPVKLTKAMKILHNQLTVLLWKFVTEAQVSNLFKNLDTNKSSIDIPKKTNKNSC